MPDLTKHPAEHCLDFANTMLWHASAQPQETLHSYADWVAWSQKAGLVPAAEARALLEHAAHHPSAADTMLERGRALREALYRVFVAHIEGAVLPAGDLDVINAELRAAASHARIVPAASAWEWQWHADQLTLERLLWPLVRSAADLLTSAELGARVGQCADDRGCGWLFLDTSKNHSRRWCDINDCGNRAKQRRHYARQRASRA